MRTSAFCASLLLCLSVLAQEPAGRGDLSEARSPKDALAEFQARTGGQWIVQWHAATGTPSAIYGPGMPIADWRENSLAEARRHAEGVLREQRELLGLGASEFREVIGARMGRTWSFTFDQFFRGLPVIEGRADVRIHMRGVVAMLGSRAFPVAADFDTTPAITEEVATAIAWNAVGKAPTKVPQPVRQAAPRLVLWGDIAAAQRAPVHLAWEVAVSNVDQQGNGPIGRYYVDAKTGAVLHYTNDKHECGIAGCTKSTHSLAAATAPAATSAALPVVTTVTVTAWTRTGNDATSALVNTPLRGLVLNVPGIGTRTTDQNGQFTIDIATPVTIAVGALDGTHFAPIAGSDTPSGSFVVNPGVNATIQLLASNATSAQAAHTTTAYWIDKTNEFARSILGNTSQMTTISGIAPNVNIASTCNASYSGNTLNFYLAGGGCSNTAFSTVIAHEWFHGLDDRYGGISNASGDGLSEGWGDIGGLYLVDSPLLGLGFQSAGVALRNGNNSRLYPPPAEVHDAGEVWMGFAWRLREALRSALGTPQAIAISNDIVIGSIVADATNQSDAVREVFLADDDDGNLLNGTPHYAQLSSAAIQKNLPYPQQSFGVITHVPLASTTERLTPRLVTATAVPSSGTFTQVALHFNTGSGTVVRKMYATGLAFLYRALLPGRTSGSVTYHIEALHSGGAIVRLPATGEFSYEVDAAAGSPFASFWLQNFDAGSAGWTSTQVLTQNDWQVGDPAGKSGTSGGIGWADPVSAASGLNCYGNDLGNTIGTTTWNGSYAANVENFLRSPVLDCTGRTGVRLRFKRWLTVEEGQFDQATILVNGQQVWQNPLVGHTIDTAWQTVEYAIPMADNNPAVQIEWRLKSDSGGQLGGWNIDDVELGTRAAPPLGAELTMLPEQAVQGAPIVMTIKTQAPALPYLFGFADGPGPTVVPGLPTVYVSGNVILIGGTTDASGSAFFFFPAPTVADAAGTLFHSQVLTIDASLTQFVTSNRFVSLFTQTP